MGLVYVDLRGVLKQVRKIVRGRSGAFREMYRPFIAQYLAEGQLIKSSDGGQQMAFRQVSLWVSTKVNGSPPPIGSLKDFDFAGLRIGCHAVAPLRSAMGG